MGVSHCEDLSFYWHIPFRWNNKQHCSILSSLLGFSMAQFSIISRAWTTKMNEIYAKKLKLLRKVTKTIMNTSCRYLWSIKWQRNCSYYRGQGNKSHHSKHSNESPPWYNYGAWLCHENWSQLLTRLLTDESERKPSKSMQLHWKQIFQILVKRKAISSYEKVQL